jgi:high affinity Mn2+ porin
MRQLLLGSAALMSVALTNSAKSADLPIFVPLKAPVAPTAYDWSGFYLGTHVGYATGTSAWSATQPGGATNLGGSLNLFNSFDAFRGTGSYFTGLQAGYNYEATSRLVFGVEADIAAPNTAAGTSMISSVPTGQAEYGETVLQSGTARGRVGYAFEKWMVYGTGGFGWTYDQLTRSQIFGTPIGSSATPGTAETILLWRFGWAAGAGIEVAIAPNWSAKLEYVLTDFSRSNVTFPAAAQRFDSDLLMQSVRLGLNYHLNGDAAKTFLTNGPSALDTDNFNFHEQTTFTSQYAPPFHVPYQGQNSLESNSGRETWDVTLYAGVRLWQGAELWINPEIDQGFGLSGTLGLAGFSSGEAYKVGASYLYARLPRTFVRQTIDLGGDSQKVESGINQFAGSQASDRLVVTVGKFSVADIFDTNKYAHDPRSDFLNWSVVETGTFDYAAEPWGYTYGAAAEWYKGPWTLRGGLFDLSIVPNNIELDPTFRQFQWVGEIEHRHELWGQPGKVAITGFLTRGRMGNYDDALVLAQATGTTPDTADVRRYGSRPGVSLNFEQQVVPNIGMFGRVGWADGSTEPYEFTDIDRTASAGLSISGKQWDRPDDTFGLAGAVNEISRAHIAYLNAGGLGILVGDGQLPHPGPEQIIETYYSLPIGAWKATVDYQFIVNPAYNRDRGPVSIIGTRLHMQF